jgi:tetratricopeptide (TPR) repeat protein
MKKLVLAAIALVCSLQLAVAQKADADMQKAVDKALAATQDAKKAAKPATWIKLAEAYMKAYNNPTSNITMGLDKQTFQMMSSEKPQSVSAVEIEGTQLEKWSLSHVDVFFNASGMLVMTVVTKPSVKGDLLGEAAKAYSKAFELGGKEKDIAPKMKEIEDDYINDALNAYRLGDMARASDLFLGAADVSALAPSAARNFEASYNSAFTAMSVKNYDRAEALLNACVENGYFSDGNVYANLSECALAKADTTAAKNYLAGGLVSYPNNPIILTNLINLYLQTKEDPAKIVELLDEAKKTLPDNASLYFVEGNIYTNIKEYDKAVAAYENGLKISPEYDMCYYGIANVAVERAKDLEAEREALDIRNYKKYDELTDKLNQVYAEAIPPFEKCYEVSKDEQVKSVAATYLKQLSFILRNKDPKYMEAYGKWDAIVKGNAQ